VNKKHLASKIKEKFGLSTAAALQIVTDVLKEVELPKQGSSNPDLMGKLKDLTVRAPFEKVGWAFEMLKLGKLTERETLMWVIACQFNEGSKDPTHYEGLEQQQIQDMWKKILK